MTDSITKLPDTAGHTFESVWATLNKMAEENEKRSAENEKRLAENEKRLTEENKKWSEKIQKLLEENCRIMGKLGNRFGEMVEHLVAPGIADKFNDLGYHFDAVMAGGVELRDENGKYLAQIDIMLENTDSVVIVEVKSKPNIDDVKDLIEKMAKVRKYRERHNHADITLLGAVAGAVFPSNVKEFATNKGLYVIIQSGDTVKIEVPDGFKPTLF